MSTTSIPHPAARVGSIPSTTGRVPLPTERDLVIDLVRVGAIAAVVLGHWLVAGLERADGGLVTVNALGPVEGLRPVTWLFQVMPLFFVAGGAANHASWTKARDRGTSGSDWIAGRLVRLVRPTVALALVWAVAAAVPALFGLEAAVMADAAWVAGIPLWFLAAYVPTIALAPALGRLGARAPALVLVGLAGGTLVVDLIGIGAGATPVRFLNLLLPWLLFQQLGFWWRESRLPSGRAAAAWAAAFLGATLAATTLGPYPVSMVSVPGEALDNTTPPTVALVLLGCTHLFAVRAMLRPLRSFTQRRPAQVALVVVGSSAMTVYLWHFTALVIVALAALSLDLPLAAVGGDGWWLAKPVWIVASAAVLAGLIRTFRRFEAPWVLPAALAPRTVAVAALLFVAAAVRMTTAGFSAGGLPLNVDLIGLGLVLGSVIALRSPLRSGMVTR
jgi:fucose 4-O-acetylase-like acetyltransferase